MSNRPRKGAAQLKPRGCNAAHGKRYSNRPRKGAAQLKPVPADTPFDHIAQ